MAFALIKHRDGQDSDHIQRFDPRFWTVDFPRPMMASVVTTGPDSLRVDAEFHRKGDLAGLIWASEDTLDHPLLGYRTDRNYARTTLRFRWRSAGVLPLDAVNGPTLTIEGRDATGAAHIWLVRLWNYAEGAPDNALITLPFSDLAGGWNVDNGGGDPVWPRNIDRLFLSLTPPGFVAQSEDLLPARANGYVELSEILCEGDRPMLEVGDVLVPPHGVQMATAYDDSYNQTPARLLRNLRGLGYRGRILHYVGMSHFYRLTRDNGTLLADEAGILCTPAQSWHGNFFALCKAQGYELIASLSYELLAQNCPASWQQRTADGTPGRTGWDPPSALLSPANPQAMGWLQAVAGRFVTLQKQAGLPVLFQIGEAWWWVTPDGAICLYDDAASTALGGDPVAIPDMRAALSAPQTALLDNAGALLAQSTAALRDAVRTAAGETETEVLLLAFTPTVLAADMPELYRANLPQGWAYPAFDRFQLEDYDWLTAGAEAVRLAAYRKVQDRLSYPPEQQDYLAGFVLQPEDAETYWQRIDAGLDEAAKRGIDQLYIWALPQVTRDGYTHFPSFEETDMQAFDDILYPLAPGRDAAVSPEFSTAVAVTASGHERRNSRWSDARLSYDVGPGIRSEEELGVLLAFFRARRGAARGFRLADPFDCSSHGMTGTPTPIDQRIGTGDGLTATFQLVKRYGSGDDPQIRPVTRPRAASIQVSVDGLPVIDGWTLGDGGTILFETAPAPGADIRAGFLFDVPVRFAEDRLDITGATFAAGEVPSVPLIEIREAV
ncbi:TIGR02217 family protein [Altericroceibacterium spongiae]|uniref:TIGR02217 family protein n=1 Tax=Altericroceibacterium spongiae TaxID=2320269 RepID=A0A420EJ40_9SPHN|nr:DUF2460 domain-containing protein [Altericroceibacterium spongiae]RKF20576.1 TIGR02217 family protein [Altericroceibacterium spongiae]